MGRGQGGLQSPQFELAASIFNDPRLLSIAATTRSIAAERWFSLGLASTGVLMAEAYLWIEVEAGPAKVRLISARRATATEIRYYTDDQ